MPSGTAIEITYGSLNLVDVRLWSETRAHIRTFDSKKVTEIEVMMTVTGQLAGNASAADRATDLAAIISDAEAEGQAFTLEQDGVTLVTLDPASNVNEGPHVSHVIPSQDMFKVGYNVPVVLSVRARIDPQGAGPILARSEEIDKQTNDKGFLVKTIRGELKVARGNSAEGQLTTVRPAVPSGFDQREAYTLDANDLKMTYAFTQTEREDDPPGSAGAGSSWSVQAAANSEGMETWVLSGRLVYPQRKVPTESDVDALIAKHFPSNVDVVNRSVTREFNERALSFAITGSRPFGKGGIYMFQQTVRVRVARSRRYFLAVDSGGKDERQDFARPAVEVTQAGTAIGAGGYPAFPTISSILQESDVDEPVQEVGRLTFDPRDGTIVAGRINWSYRGRILNKIDAGKIATFKDVLGDPKDIAAKHPVSGQTAAAKVA